MTIELSHKILDRFVDGELSPREMENLSPREQEVLNLLARGFLYKEIAESLSLSVPTVNTYIRRIYEKLQVRSRGQAVAKYLHQAPASGHGNRNA